MSLFVTGMSPPVSVRKDSKDLALGNSIGPTASEFGCMSWKGENGSQYHYGLDPIYLNAGRMKPQRGFTLITGEEKMGVGKHLQLDEGELNLKSRIGID